MAAQPFNIHIRHEAPREVDGSVNEFWLTNPFDFGKMRGVNLSMFERNRLFFNEGGGRSFADVSYLSGADTEADTRAVAVGDLDEDGRPDLVVRSTGGGAVRIFLNRIQGRSSLVVTLGGTRSNSDGIGARLLLEVDGRRLYREHFPKNSLLAQSANETIFGLGDHPRRLRLTITWPSGVTQVLENLKPGRIHVKEPRS